jgi:drug/metabolite transporter (DMT)-like permease
LTGHSLSPARWLLLFAATSVTWGSSFLFIRIAVEHMPPSMVVFAHSLTGVICDGQPLRRPPRKSSRDLPTRK